MKKPAMKTQEKNKNKRSKYPLAVSKPYLDTIAEAIDGMIYICSQDYRVEYMNPRLIKYTGYDGTGGFCFKALHNRDSVCPWCVNQRVFKGETLCWEIQSPKDNHWHSVVDTPIFHEDGTVSKQSIFFDITERKLIEEQLKQRE